jgi:hypothetical protein
MRPDAPKPSPSEGRRLCITVWHHDRETPFGRDGRLLVTPGLVIFHPALVSTLPVDTTILAPVTLQLASLRNH